MKILVTNDDGIFSEGLAIVVRWAASRGNEVLVAAPSAQQSGKSHALTIHQPFAVEKAELGLGEAAAYAVASTPVDCVRFATLGLNKTFDLIISGINKGFNMGEDILYSGTCGAIFEAKLRGARGIALSTEYTTFEYAAKSLDKIAEFFQKRRLFDFHPVYNVNIPLEPAEEILLTHQGGAYFTDDFFDLGDGMWEQRGYCVHENHHDKAIDTDATIDGYITVTPLTTDRSDVEAWRKIAKDV